MSKENKPLSPSAARRLLNAAEEARKRAYAPYSDFSVGAALLTKSGMTVTGSNVENASFGATVCAERSAVLTAVSAGHLQFSAIAVVAGTKSTAVVPCGLCLQVLAEFCEPEFLLLLAPAQSLKPVKRFRLRDLLPITFKFKKNAPNKQES